MNDTVEDSDSSVRSLPVTIVLCVAYSAVFLLGVTGNCLVVTVVFRSPRMRSPTNIFIANLACADLLVNVICLPFTLISNIMGGWTMGWLLCKTIPYLQGVSVNASINTLVAISVERYLAICYPLRWQMTSRTCRTAVLLIWLVSLTITLPWAVFFKLQTPNEGSDFETCLESWPTPYSENVYFVVANLVMCYLLPLVLISICYFLIWRRVCCRTLPGEPHGNGHLLVHRSKVKVIKMLLVVIVLFAFSWAPLYAIITRIKLGGPLDSDPERWIIFHCLPFAQWLGASNSCINPILYAFFNRKFRAGFQAILHSGSCCSPLYYDACSDIRTLSGKDSLMFRTTKLTKDLKRSKQRMTISAGPSFLIKPLKCRVDSINNIRAMSLRTTASNMRRRSVSADNIRQEDQENIKNRHGTLV